MSFFKSKYRILKHRAGYLVQVKHWWSSWKRLDYGGEHDNGVFESYDAAARFVVREIWGGGGSACSVSVSLGGREMTPLTAEQRAHILKYIEQAEKELKAEVVWGGEVLPPLNAGEELTDSA